MKTHDILGLGLGLGTALLLGACFQTEGVIIDEREDQNPPAESPAESPAEPPAPIIDFDVAFIEDGSGYGCGVATSTPLACELPFPAGSVLEVTVRAYTRNGSQPAAALQFSDGCGGTFVDQSDDRVGDTRYLQAKWQMPEDVTECDLVAEAIGDEDEVLGAAVIQIFVGEPPPELFAAAVPAR